MPVSEKPWGSISEADYTPAQFCRASLIDMNQAGAEKVKANCKLPVREPDGTINRNGCHAAAAVLAGGRGGVSASPAEKRAAARKLMAIYRRDLDEEPPESMMRR
jgi:hypothetical protein